MRPSPIESATPADANAIAAVHRAAFPGPGEATLVATLAAAGAASVSRVARRDGAIVGHVLLSPVRIDWDGALRQAALETPPRSHAWLGLAPLGVLPALQRQGLGAALVWDALARAREHGADAVVLLGDPRYYARFGFGAARRFGLRCRWPGTDEAFMLRELHDGSVAAAARAAGSATGIVHYHPAFDALD